MLPTTYIAIKLVLLTAIALGVAYLMIGCVFIYFGIPCNMFLRCKFRKRYALLFIVIALPLGSFIDSRYQQQFDFYPESITDEDIVGLWHRDTESIEISPGNVVTYRKNAGNIAVYEAQLGYELNDSVIHITNDNDRLKLNDLKVITFRNEYIILEKSVFEKSVENSITDLGYRRISKNGK